MLNIFFAGLTSSIILFGFGIIFNYLFFNISKNEINIYETGIFGIIFLSLISLFINFFLPINKFIGTTILIISFVVFFYFIYFVKKKFNVIYIILLVSFIAFTLITLSNINRPDAGLYHLPYVSLLQESKIIIGSANIHHRFGMVSIVQYLSAIHNNYFFKTEFINVPLACIFSFYIIFVLRNFYINLKKNNFEKVFINFLIIIFSFYAFNRYSNYGNDAPAHIFFFILTIFFIEIQNLEKIELNEFYKIAIVSLFLLSLKSSMVVVLLLPLVLFFLCEKKLYLIKKKQFFLCLFIIFIWFLKNILTSGCLIYQLNTSCIQSLKYFNKENTLRSSQETEAWAKGFPDSKNKFSLEDYNKNFNWLYTWKKHHLKKIIEKILPYLILLLLILLMIIFRKIYFKDNLKKLSINKKDYILLFFSFFCCTIWFIKFPVYRFGMSFIFIFLTSLFIILFKKIEKSYNFKFYNFFFITLILIGILGFLGKNYYRIVNKFDEKYNNYPWPRIYTLSNTKENLIPKYKKIIDKKNQTIFYYSGGTECMYSKSPCSNYLNSKLKMIKKHGYKIYYND